MTEDSPKPMGDTTPREAAEAGPHGPEGTNDSRAGWEAEVARLAIVEPSRVRIRRDDFRRLCVRLDDGPEFVDVRPAPAFPVSGAAGYISFLDADDKEVLLMAGTEGLDPDSRQCLEDELDRVYFVPRILRIYDIEDAHGAARWEVETDRGYRMFDVRDREDVRVVEGSRILLQDADGNRYEIPDLFALDERSRRLVDGEI